MITIDKVEYEVNHFDYFWNGSVLSVLFRNKTIGPVIPKNKYNEIMFTNHKVVDCGLTDTIPRQVDFRKSGYKAIIMDK